MVRWRRLLQARSTVLRIQPMQVLRSFSVGTTPTCRSTVSPCLCSMQTGILVPPVPTCSRASRRHRLLRLYSFARCTANAPAVVRESHVVMELAVTGKRTPMRPQTRDLRRCTRALLVKWRRKAEKPRTWRWLRTRLTCMRRRRSAAWWKAEGSR